MSNLTTTPQNPPIYNTLVQLGFTKKDISKDNHLPIDLVEAVWEKILNPFVSPDNNSDRLEIHFIEKDSRLAPLQLDNEDLLNFIESLHKTQDSNFTLSVPSDKYAISNIYLSNVKNPLLESLMILNVALALGCERKGITVAKAHSFLKTQKNPLYDRKGEEQLKELSKSNAVVNPRLISDFVYNSQDTVVKASMFVFEFVTKGESYMFCEVYSRDCNPTKHTFHCDSDESSRVWKGVMYFDPNNGYPHYNSFSECHREDTTLVEDTDLEKQKAIELIAESFGMTQKELLELLIVSVHK